VTDVFFRLLTEATNKSVRVEFIGPGTNFVEFISKSAGAERLRKF